MQYEIVGGNIPTNNIHKKTSILSCELRFCWVFHKITVYLIELGYLIRKYLAEFFFSPKHCIENNNSYNVRNIIAHSFNTRKKWECTEYLYIFALFVGPLVLRRPTLIFLLCDNRIGVISYYRIFPLAIELRTLSWIPWRFPIAPITIYPWLVISICANFHFGFKRKKKSLPFMLYLLLQ